MMRHKFHPEALKEYEAAARSYAACPEGREREFIACVESTIHQLCQNPAKRGRVFEQDTYRCLVPVFPYAILYLTQPTHVVVLAFTHANREPGDWRDRIE